MPTIDFLNEILSVQPPSGLYHYTDSSGLLGILSSNKIRVTKLQYLNDNTELQLALDYFRQEIIDEQNGASKTTRTPDELEAMLEAINNFGGVNIGVASFTKMGDQLSQWRGYSQIGNGYSLCFSGPKLLEVANTTKGYHLVRCYYEENEHRNIAKALIRSAPFLNIKQSPNFGKPPFFEMTFAEAVLFFAPIIKSASFKEEMEWRLISPTMSYLDAQFRPGSHSIIPYWDFDLHLEDTLLDIIIGPTPEKELSELALKGLIAREVDKNKISPKMLNRTRHSNIPFRKT